MPARLLDVDLVVYRTSKGLAVAKGLCPHRGTRLSGGWLSRVMDLPGFVDMPGIPVAL